jgi:NAD+ diphosphatase
VATAAGVLVEGREGILLIERARDPSRGLLCLPGGFVEPGERAEEGARRECREEIGWEPGELVFFGSFPNAYEYAGVPYATCDLYFLARVESLDAIAFRPDPGECASLVTLRPEAVAGERLAFESQRRAIRAYLEARRQMP